MRVVVGDWRVEAFCAVVVKPAVESMKILKQLMDTRLVRYIACYYLTDYDQFYCFQYGKRKSEVWLLLFTASAWNAWRGLAMRKLCVCPFVCTSVKRADCDKTEESSVQIFIPHKRSFSLVFWEEWLVGATLSTWNFGSTGQLTLIGSRQRAFQWT